jgi:hypothetical protein|tara:strand:+ start:3749 stop:4039 length:291 start_codon:yes stop_codon:yes gene_type:complete
MLPSYDVKIRELKYSSIRASNQIDAAGLALSRFLKEYSMEEIPVVIFVIETYNDNLPVHFQKKIEEEEKLIFSPVVLADLGFHKESAILMKKIKKL